MDLLQGTLSTPVMKVITDQETGLFHRRFVACDWMRAIKPSPGKFGSGKETRPNEPCVREHWPGCVPSLQASEMAFGEGSA
jgi:hypothetical protein